MAAVSLVTAGVLNVVSSETQLTASFAESCNVGQLVRFDTTGQWTKGNASSGTENRVWGILVSKDGAGGAGTAVRRGILNGYDLSGLAFGAIVYLPDTDGGLADAPGTTTMVIGRVIPGFSTTTGTTADKLLWVDIDNGIPATT